MRRSAMVVVASAICVAAIAACGGGSSGSGGSSGGGSAPARYDGKPVTITFWNPFTQRQLAVMNSVIAGFHKLYPKITVKSRGGVTDDNIVAAIRGANAQGLEMLPSKGHFGESYEVLPPNKVITYW